MPIKVTYTNQDINEYDLFEEIPNCNLVIKINCSVLKANKLTSLPAFGTNMNFPNLEEFTCANNQLTSLPDMNFPNLQVLTCANNQLTSLPDMNFPNLQYFKCCANKLIVLPDNIVNFSNLQVLDFVDNNLKVLPNNMNFPKLQKFNCNDNQLTKIPDNMNFPNLQYFNCADNQLTSLADNMNFPNLEEFYCDGNQLTLLPENMNFPNLEEFYCDGNQLTLLPENMNFPNLQIFSCYDNQLTSLQALPCGSSVARCAPENMNFPDLQIFYCYKNQLTALPENMNFPNLRGFHCNYNQLTSLPVCILNFRHLHNFIYYNNMIEMSLQMARFIDRIDNISHLNIYTDNQNVHNSTIQLSVRDSINCITTRPDLQKYDIDQLHILIIKNTILTETSKSLLFEYIADTTVHSSLLLTFSNVLWFIIQTIITDFTDIIQVEIFKILNQEIIDADCRCFTGRMNRVINCLNGFSPLVSINIKDGEQIGTRS